MKTPQSNTQYEFDAVCLGAVGITAAWRRHKPDVKNRCSPVMVISQSSTVDDGAFVPAADVTIVTIHGLLALRDAIDEALRYDVPKLSEVKE
jgi:hypothetical protein